VTAGGRHFLFLRKTPDRAINYWCVDPDGRERQLTHFPATPDMPKYAQWSRSLRTRTIRGLPMRRV